MVCFMIKLRGILRRLESVVVIVGVVVVGGFGDWKKCLCCGIVVRKYNDDL